LESLIITIITSLTSGLIGVLVGSWITRYNEKRQEKVTIMKTLIMHIREPGNPERVMALNIIPVVFHKEQNICTAFDNYKVAQNDAMVNYNNPQIFGQKLSALNDSYIKLVELMAKKLHYNATITWDKLKNPYIPQCYSDFDGYAHYY